MICFGRKLLADSDYDLLQTMTSPLSSDQQDTTEEENDFEERNNPTGGGVGGDSDHKKNDDTEDDADVDACQEEGEEDPFWSVALQGPDDNNLVGYGTNAFIVEEFGLYGGRRNARDEYDGSEQGGDEDHDGDWDQDEQQQQQLHNDRSSLYRLPYTSTTLELAPLPLEDGIWGPLGGDAWYASALLTAMVLEQPHEKDLPSEEEEECRLKNKTPESTYSILPPLKYDVGSSSTTTKDKPFRVLELGSGAMSLPGLACAVALEKIRQHRLVHVNDSNNIGSSPSDDASSLFSWQVCLTDNDPDVLRQLKKNVRRNRCKIFPSKQPYSKAADDMEEKSSSNSSSSVLVRHLDWGGGNVDSKVDLYQQQKEEHQPSSENQNIDDGNKNEYNDDDPTNSDASVLDGVDIVIGSELVYTEITARALLKVLLELLRRNPKVKIWIVQVTDRFGWNDIVLPALEKYPSIVIDSMPISVETHQVASTLIPMGGTLDRYAFGAICIHNLSPSNEDPQKP